jgi:hypothetical protein
MRSGKIIAINDHLIDELLADSRYKVQKNGVILKNGKQVGSKDKEGYIRVFYGQNRRIYAHRIVYRAFNGPLQKDLVVEHRDGDTSNNAASNLLLVTHKKNIEYKNRRLARTGK